MPKLNVGDFVLTRYNEQGVVTEISPTNGYCYVDVDGVVSAHYFTDITEVIHAASDEDFSDAEFGLDEEDTVIDNKPVFKEGDTVFIGDNLLIPCSVIKYMGTDDMGDHWYELDMDGTPTAECQSNLRKGSSVTNNTNKRQSPVREKVYIGAVCYEYDNKKEYRICDIDDFMSFLHWRELWPGLKTFIYKTGHAFPGTVKFTQTDIENLKKYGTKTLEPKVGDAVWLYQGGHAVVKAKYRDEYEVKRQKDGRTEYVERYEMFIPVTDEAKRLRVGV